MSWGGLNPALTAWRNGVNLRFPRRGTASDGGYADSAHSSSSEHTPDADGTVDAFDMDVNLLSSGTQTGSAAERRIIEALKLDFQDDPRAQLWISYRKISNRDIGPWRVRDYTGPSPHDHHVHWQSRQSLERDGRPWKLPRTDALIGWLDMDEARLRSIIREELAPVRADVKREASEIPKELMAYPVIIPASGGRPERTVDLYTLLRWLDPAQVDTRRQILEKLSELHPGTPA
jgi:hypothetical protein